MKKIKQLNQDYHHWLKTLGYSASTMKVDQNNLNDLSIHLANQGLNELSDINTAQITKHIEKLLERKHRTKDQGLSLTYVKSHRSTLARLNRYLSLSYGKSFTLPILKGKTIRKPLVFTKEQINKLYQVADQIEDPNDKQEYCLAQRERVILSLYYGCGLRRNEGANLQLSDVLLTQSLLYIRKGKGNKERYVPMSKQVKTDLEHYLKYARPILLREQINHDLLLSWKGTALKAEAITARFKLLLLKAELKKEGSSLHSLRHSIATHLLQSGMKLEQIAKFLGHRSLESTQIYTHIAHEHEL